MADETGIDHPPGSGALPAAAERVLENLAEMEPELVQAGIFDEDGRAVATTAGSDDWSHDAAELLEALEVASKDETLDSAHVATAEGEVFAVRDSGLSLVAVTGRFVLASLTSYDMRMALRDAARSRGRAEGSASPEAESGGEADA